MRQYYGANTAFLDLLFNALLGFVALFFIAYILINPEAKLDNASEAKAEFVITTTWDNELNNDVDSYLQDPADHLVFFRRREDGLMHLDRDDLGHSNDTFKTPDGETIKYNENREIITIRGIIPGEYVMNVHMYAKRTPNKPTEVTVQIDKINPTLKTVAIKKVTLDEDGDEKTVCRFLLDKKGSVVSMNQLPKTIADKAVNGGGFDENNYEEEVDP